MKNTISALTIITAFASGSAFAADLPSRTPPPVYVPPAPVFTWTGPYAGLNIGGGWRSGGGNSNNNVLLPAAGGIVFLPTSNGSNSAGVVGGGQIGYNYQFTPLFVAGVETDFQGTSIGSGGNGGFGLNGNERITWFGTVRGRLGITPPFNSRLFIYGTGGFAYGEVRQGGFFDNQNTKTGWTAGGGIEWALLPHWSVKAEYLYTDLNSGGGNGNEVLNLGNGIAVLGGHRQTRFNTVRAGVNYHFDLFPPAPIVAKY